MAVAATSHDAASATARRALAWAHSARFLCTAGRLDQLPPPDLPEFAFVGRSNAGKSTAINAIAHQRRLAFASRTPGRTQHVNLFDVGPAEAPDTRWADLPGYGYAAVAREAKLRWQKVMADYLAYRRAIDGIVMLVDVRHSFTPLDLQLLRFIAPRVSIGEVRLLVLLTKADKLSRAEAGRALAQAQRTLAAADRLVTDNADVGITLFSALSGQGIADAAVALRGWRDAVDAPRSAVGPADAVGAGTA